MTLLTGTAAAFTLHLGLGSGLFSLHPAVRRRPLEWVAFSLALSPLLSCGLLYGMVRAGASMNGAVRVTLVASAAGLMLSLFRAYWGSRGTIQLPGSHEFSRVLPVILVLGGLAVILVGIPAIQAGGRQILWDSGFNAAITGRILEGEIPPTNPLFGGAKLYYPWFYNLYLSLVSQGCSIVPFQAMAVSNIFLLSALFLSTAAFCRLLTEKWWAQVVGSLFALIAANPFGWIFAALRASQITSAASNPGSMSVQSISWVSFHFPTQLSTLLYKYLAGNSISLCLPLVFLAFVTVYRSLSGRESSYLPLVFLTAAGLFYFYPLGAAFALPGLGLGAALWLLVYEKENRSRGALRLLVLGVFVLAGFLSALPYLSSIAGNPAGSPMSLQDDARGYALQLYTLAVTAGATALLAAYFLLRSYRKRNRLAILMLGYIVVLGIASLTVEIVVHNFYKLVLLFVTPLGAWAGVGLCKMFQNRHHLRPGLGKLAMILPLVWIPTTLLVWTTHVIDPPPKHSINEDEARLYSWLQENTPTDAVVVDDPSMEWVPVYARRSQVLCRVWGNEVWGYEVAPVMEIVDRVYSSRGPLGADLNRLRSLDRPVYLLERPQWSLDWIGSATGNAEFSLIYRSGPFRLYRLKGT